MADFFMSLTDKAGGDTISKEPDHVGTSGTSGDKIELRADQTCTQRQMLNAIYLFERWIVQGGLNAAGANLPSAAG